MGYCMFQVKAKFGIRKANLGKALDAVKGLAGKETIKDCTGRHFSWVEQGFDRKPTLAEATACWRWNLETDPATGDVVGIAFGGEKIGDDAVLFGALAPYVAKGSYIEMQGEDGLRWRWAFDGKKCAERQGKVVYG